MQRPIVKNAKDRLETSSSYVIDLIIDETGDWYFESNKIINLDVLRYFKQQLNRDTEGYYIYNSFRNFSEKAYIQKLKTFPLFVTSIEIIASLKDCSLHIVLDSGKKLTIPVTSLYIDSFENDRIVFVLLENEVPARLSQDATIELCKDLQVQDDIFILKTSNRSYKIEYRSIKDFLPHFIF